MTFVEAVAGAFGHQRVFELRDRAEDLKEHPADRWRGRTALSLGGRAQPSGVGASSSTGCFPLHRISA
jgi:hypothetical protein